MKSARLDRIVSTRVARVEQEQRLLPLARVRRMALDAARGPSMIEGLSGCRLSIIAEIKRGSPSRGVFSDALNPEVLARAYVDGGASAISVLTEHDHFLGSYEDLERVRETVSLPILCKDFIFSPYQVYRARAAGADAVLLIAAILSDKMLAELRELTHHLGMQALVEVHEPAEMDRAIGVQADLIGINNRNLRDFSVNLEVFETVAPLAPGDAVLVAESGIHTAADAARMARAGASAILVGERLVRALDPADALRELLEGEGPSP